MTANKKGAPTFESDINPLLVADRYAYFADFFDNFYNVDKLSPDRISKQAVQ